MGLLDIVDKEDNIIGEAEFMEAHEKGLRHRSVQVFVFKSLDYKKFNRQYEMMENSELLVAQLSRNRKAAALKLGPSVGGHVKKGQSYLDAAIEELKEELFYEIEYPTGIELGKVGDFINDSDDGWKKNRENSALYATYYEGPFSPDPKETEKIFWQPSWEIYEDMKRHPDKYTSTFVKAMDTYLFAYDGNRNNN